MKSETYYIGLGSNLGFRHDNILRALYWMKNLISRNVRLSSIYTSPPMGFSSKNKFLNAVAELKTEMPPEKVYAYLKQIEDRIHPENKKRNAKNQYSDRYIDLDIITYSGPPVMSEQLIIPHPRFKQRDFVCVPLLELNPNLQDPITKEPLKNFLPKKPKVKSWKGAHQKLICIEGNIGAGKTTLMNKIKKKNSQKIYERYEENPWLAKFYADKVRYAYRTECWFLKERHTVWKKIFPNNFDFTFTDYLYLKTFSFASVNLSDEEKENFKQLWERRLFEIPQPDAILYCHVTTALLLPRIHKRGRAFEKNIRKDYLEKIHQKYLELFAEYPHIPAIKIYPDDAPRIGKILNNL
ncbi:MAG: 2-amino-4-hydroxy-6-hydroxymethyldihydropteridine diphosphokinase [Bacteroidia bacterium]|nr:2-amino-4-hydroxy-6-hydroxymethyldihydropteridine diphosphokinase [Bacteroidia bacterium]